MSAGAHPPPERGPAARAVHGCTTGQNPNGGTEAGGGHRHAQHGRPSGTTSDPKTD